MSTKSYINTLFASIGMAVLVSSTLLIGSPLQVHTLFNQDGIGVVPTDKDPKNPLTRGWFLETLAPGQSVERSADIINNSEEDAVIEIRAKDSEQTGEGSFSFVENGKQDTQVGSWIKLSADKVEVPANRMTPVKFTVTVPEGTKPGEYAGVIAVQLAPKDSDEAVKFVSRVGARIYITVPGELNTGVKINRFEFMQPKSSDYIEFNAASAHLPYDQMYIALNLENIGNVYGKTRGAVEITTPSGEKITQDFDRDFAPLAQAVNSKLDMRNKWQVGTYKAKFAFDNSPIIPNGKDNIQDISPTKMVETEFTMTQEMLDQMKADKSDKAEARQKALDAADKGGNKLEVVNTIADADTSDKQESEKTESNDTLIYVMGGVIILLLVAILGYFGYKEFQKSKNSSQKQNSNDTEK